MTSRETIGIRSLKHGHTAGRSKTPEYEAYCGAKRRCNSPKRKDFERYGGRGIKFLFDNFADFLNALGPRPSTRHSVGRIDNDGHYEAGNVRWETIKEQNNNRRPKGPNKKPVIFSQQHKENLRLAQLRRWARTRGEAA